MPRSRNIKPGICQNEYLAELPYETRFLFAVLPCFADREGRMEDRPKKIKMQVFPADNLDMDELLSDLHRAGFIQRYTVDNSRYIQIVNFSRHQNPHVNEKPSDIPPPPESEESTVQAPEQHGANPADSFNLIPDSLKERDAAAPPTIWDLGTKAGLPRSLIGKWIKNHGEERTAEAISKIEIKCPADPVQWGTAYLQERPKKLYVPKVDDELEPWAKKHGLPGPTATETYYEYRQRLWGLVRQGEAA